MYFSKYFFSKPTGRILKSSEKGLESAPFVVSFSSRGPNAITSDILKVKFIITLIYSCLRHCHMVCLLIASIYSVA